MDWRNILKFDENLYRHTNDETKEKHRRILEFIGKQPKGKRLGNKIKDFVETGELDDSISPLDLPRNNITPKTREFYSEINKDVLFEESRYYSRDDPFSIVRKRVGDAVKAALKILDYQFRPEVPADMYEALKTAISRLIRYYYYDLVPNFNGDFIEHLNIGVEGELGNESDYRNFVLTEITEKFDESDFLDMIMDCVVPVLMVGFLHSYPNMAFTSIMRGRRFKGFGKRR